MYLRNNEVSKVKTSSKSVSFFPTVVDTFFIKEVSLCIFSMKAYVESKTGNFVCSDYRS